MVQIKSLENFVPPTSRQNLQLQQQSTSSSSSSSPAAPPKPSSSSKGKQKASSSSSTRPLTTPESSLLSFLSTFSSSTLSSSTFSEDLQALKGLLYHKKYAEAFSTSGDLGELRRDVYVARWVPSRTIIFRRVFDDLGGVMRRVWGGRRGEEEGKEKEREVICLGGGAGSELATLASILSERDDGERWRITCIDMGQWDSVLSRMNDSLLSHYPNLQDRFTVNFINQDLLSLSPPSSSPPSSETPLSLDTLSLSPSPPLIPYSTASLITLFFTLSELFLESLPQTLAYLRSSSTFSLCRPGTILLLIESASLSTIPLGKNGRIYSITTVLDHALGADVEGGRKGSEGWEVVEDGDGEEGGRWYRMPEGAQEAYAGKGGKEKVKLEGSRVVVRAYRKR